VISIYPRWVESSQRVVCFDTPLVRGNGGASAWRSPILCEGQSEKGRSQVD
jgi:hypothetical protein